MQEIIHAFGIDWRLLIIQMVNFFLLMFILTKFLYRPLLNMIEERQMTIESGLENAKEAELALSAANDEAKIIKQNAHHEAQAAIARGKKLGEEEHHSIVSKAEQDREAIVSQAKREAENLRLKALEDAKEDVARLAVLTAEKILTKPEYDNH
jgi:F-type H+-transporting ATPase subunit b